MATHSISCLENPHGQRSLVGYSPWGCKELGTTERLNTTEHLSLSLKWIKTYCTAQGTLLCGSPGGRGGWGRMGTHVYVWLSPFAVHLNL